MYFFPSGNRVSKCNGDVCILTESSKIATVFWPTWWYYCIPPWDRNVLWC